MLKEIGIFGAVIIGIVILSIGGLILKVVFIPLFGAQKLVQTNYDIIDKTLTADNAIYNYEWFKDRKEAIDANYQKIAIAQKAVSEFEGLAGARKDWTFEDKNEDARLRSISQGLEGNTKDLIAEYNARAQMANRNIFQTGLIPNVLNYESNLLK